MGRNYVQLARAWGISNREGSTDFRRGRESEKENAVDRKTDRTEEFIRLFAANQRRIYGFVAAMVPNADDADDVFQNVSAGLWQKFDRFEPGTNFAAWGLQFARYAVLKYFETQRRRKRLVFADEVLELVADEATAANKELDRRHEALRSCIERLPDRSRELVRVRYEAGVGTCKEVACRVDRSVEAVYKALSRIHQRLLECVERVLAGEEGS